MTIAKALKIEQGAESADAGNDSGYSGFARDRADAVHQLIAGLNVHAGFGVGQSLSRHLDCRGKTLGKKSSIRRYDSAQLNEIHIVEPTLDADAAPASRARIPREYSPNFG